MTTELPPDAANVRASLRLGWLMAEVRGRARPGGPGSEFVSDMYRSHWALPLASERSAAERAVESEYVLATVAKHLKLDWPATSRRASDPPGAKVPDDLATGSDAEHSAPAERKAPDAAHPVPDAAHPASEPPPTFSDEMVRLGKLIDRHRKKGDEPAANATWWRLAPLLYHWDAKIQDELLVNPSQANAYELGRAVAEMYWALDLDAPAQAKEDQGTEPNDDQVTKQDTKREPKLNPVSWEFLFGDSRRSDISRLLSRLAPFFPPLTPAAVAGSVEVWGKVAASEQWRSADNVRKILLAQTTNWYSLLVAGLDPETMLKPYAGLRSWRIFKKAFRTFGFEMVVGTLGIVAIAGLVLLIAYAPHQPVLKAVVAVLGFLGVTGAGLQARLKATTQSMFARLSADLSTELVAEQITVMPPAPRSMSAQRMLQTAIASRSVTAPLDK